ncbi:MAG TPA: shikimate dehydrogenase [Actinomycetota bacterium]|jgi:shikimate dehydrogenase
MLNGATKVVGIMGGPHQVPLSLSPRIHNAAFRALGLDWVYVGFPVAEGSVAAAVRGLAVAGVRGFNVTMPHKMAVAACLDRLEGLAATVGAVNTVEIRGSGELVGWNTDGDGLLRFLRLDVGAEVKGTAALVVGAGGAARSAVAALARAGAGSVTVLARNRDRAEDLRGIARGTEFRAAGLGSSDQREREASIVAASDLIVNATPVGQIAAVPSADAEDRPPIPVEAIRPGTVVVDMVYKPPVTRLVEEARARGADAHGGLGMLLHQAALAFEIWTGQDPPLEAMSAAAVSALSHS